MGSRLFYGAAEYYNPKKTEHDSDLLDYKARFGDWFINNPKKKY